MWQLVAVMLAIALAGCAATDAPTPSAAQASALDGATPTEASPLPAASAGSPTASPEASPTPSQDEIRSVAADGYLAAVGPTNKAFTTLWKQYKNKTSLKAWRQYCAKLATTLRSELVALQAISWPTDTAADAKALIRSVAAQEANERSCAAAKTWAEWRRFDTRAYKANLRSHELANLVRLDLGLPPVPG
ncbi:MAG: hypothetical protein AB1627_15330 [Chloroflexota bacterium]